MKEDCRFAHRHNGFFLFLVTGMIIAACVPLILMSFEKGGYFLVLLPAYGGVLVFLVWLLLVRRKYVLKEDHLLTVTGPVSRRYDYRGITRVRYLKGTAFRSPGFRIYYMGRETAVINPEGPEAFIEALKKRCPGAEYE